MMIKSQADAEAAFAEGNYSRAAFLAETNELRGAALAMVGALEESVSLLATEQTPRALFSRALANWGLGQQEAALTALAHIKAESGYGKAAAKLSDFIQRDKIRILVQGRDDPKCPDYDLIGALRKIPNADVVSVGYSPHADVVIDYTSSLEDVMEQLPPGWVPDVYLNHLVEDNPPPYGIERAPFPTVFHSQDYDRHVQQCHGYLTLCDVVVALGSADHAELKALSRRPTVVYPLLLGIDVESDRNAGLPRTKDIYISGSLFNNGLGKARCVYEIVQLADAYRIDLVDGFVSATEYYQQLGRAKATFTYVNRWGALNGRAVEAISVGTCALVQEGTELQLYVSPEQGAIPFREDNFLDVLQDVIGNWDARYAAYGQAGVGRVREVFEFSRCIQRYFNFLVATASTIEPGARTPAEHGMTQPRYPTHSPWRVPFHFVDTDHVIKLQDQFRRHVARGGQYLHLDALGESFLYSYVALKRADLVTDAVTHAASAMLGGAVRVYQLLVQQYPERIAARFNLARALFEQGERAAASQVFTELLTTSGLQFSPNDTLFWKEVQDAWFDYDLLMEQGMAFRLTGDEACLGRIGQAIRESAAFYLAGILVEEGDGRSALEVLEAIGELSYPPLSLLRAMLRLQFGHGVGATTDVNNALAQRPWDALKLGEAFLAQASELGCPVDPWLSMRSRLQSRVRYVPKDWPQEKPLLEGFVTGDDSAALTPEQIERAVQILNAIEAWRAADRNGPIAPTEDQQMVLSNAYAALVSGGEASFARLRWWTGGVAGSSIDSLREAARREEFSDLSDGAKRLSFVRRRYPEELLADPPLIFGEAGWLSDGHLLSDDGYRPVERVLALYDNGVIDWLRTRQEAGQPIRILELGAGYGALAHLMLHAFPQCEYVIADWPEALAFSANYLGVAHPERKLTFGADAVLTNEGGKVLGMLPYPQLQTLVVAEATFDLVIYTPDALEWQEAQARHFCKQIRRLIGKHGLFFEQSMEDADNGGLTLQAIVRQYFAYDKVLGVRALLKPFLGVPRVWGLAKIDDVLGIPDTSND